MTDFSAWVLSVVWLFALGHWKAAIVAIALFLLLGNVRAASENASAGLRTVPAAAQEAGAGLEDEVIGVAERLSRSVDLRLDCAPAAVRISPAWLYERGITAIEGTSFELRCLALLDVWERLLP
mgnify:CR=1 FL=1